MRGVTSMGSGESVANKRKCGMCGVQEEMCGDGCLKGCDGGSGDANCLASGNANEGMRERRSGETDADEVDKPTPEK